jgi:hypothetical protein
MTADGLLEKIIWNWLRKLVEKRHTHPTSMPPAELLLGFLEHKIWYRKVLLTIGDGYTAN